MEMQILQRVLVGSHDQLHVMVKDVSVTLLCYTPISFDVLVLVTICKSQGLTVYCVNKITHVRTCSGQNLASTYVARVKLILIIVSVLYWQRGEPAGCTYSAGYPETAADSVIYQYQKTDGS